MPARRLHSLLIAALLVAGWLGGVAAAKTEELKAEDLSSLCLNPPTLVPDVPGDTPVNDQRSINCLAWQTFIALNWPADGGPPSDFGRRGDLSPVTWTRFVDISNLRAHLRRTGVGEVPDGDPLLPVPDTCPADDTATLTLRQLSKFSFGFALAEQVFPASQPAWLADRDANLVLYQTLISRQEYDYIHSQGLLSRAAQYPALAFGRPVDMPRGAVGGNIGSIEIKAAWLMLPPGAETEARWRERYKLARARIYDEGDGDCRIRTVALIGLHIVHKTESNPQWIWSTFEHVDNAPDAAAVAEGTADGDRYRFWSDHCEARPVPASCGKLSAGHCRPLALPPATTSCAPNTAPAYCMDLFSEECPPYPIQVTRQLPIADSGDNLVQQTNAAVRQMIRDDAGADSVWQYYQLIGTSWSGSPVEQNTPGGVPPSAPLSIAGMRPNGGALPLVNSVVETYIQSTGCVSCHRTASIATTKASGPRNFAADYSFVLRNLRGAADADRPGAKP